MHILLANDDGQKARGINILKETLDKKFRTTLIAPDQERSSCGHGISLAHPIRAQKVSDGVYSCSGLPADCVLIGLGALLKDDKPDVIVSGINHGANLGQDRFYSGTIAAAREGSFRGVPSIAVSLVNYFRTSEEHFETAAKFISLFLK